MYKKYFKKQLNEEGPNYVASRPNTAGSGGALGNASSMYSTSYASGTAGTDTYNTGDYRLATSIFGGIIQKRGKKKRGSRPLANKSRNKRK